MGIDRVGREDGASRNWERGGEPVPGMIRGLPVCAVRVSTFRGLEPGRRLPQTGAALKLTVRLSRVWRARTPGDV